MTLSNIALTGHTSGLGLELTKHFQIDGFSRSNGYNINDLEKLINAVKDYDILINNAYNDNQQYLLCKELWKIWKNNPNKKIINIGSHAKDFIKSDYGLNKNILSTFTSYCNLNGKCKVTCINPGYINNDSIKASDIAEIIQWIIDKDYTLEEITLFKGIIND